MNKELFVGVVDELKKYYREVYPKFEELGMMSEESPILARFDAILETVHNAIDPKNIGENLLTHDTPLIFDFIFEDKPSCVTTSGEFYDYVKTLYEKHASEIEKIHPYHITPL